MDDIVVVAPRAGERGAVDLDEPAERRPIWLSVLVPVYNVAPYLEECVDSIVSQADDGVEILLLDDASTDGSTEILDTLLLRHGSVLKLLSHPQNRGLSAARNTMMEHARGDYIWFVDSDDRLEPGAIGRLASIVRQHQPDLILCDYGTRKHPHRRTFAGPSRRLLTDPEGLVAGIFAKRRLHVWTKIAKRSLWAEDLRFPEGRCFEDNYTIPWLLLRTRSHYHVPEPWVFYRIRPDSIVGLAARAKRGFDVRRNEDMAQGLAGYPAILRATLPNARRRTLMLVSRYSAKEFAKIGKRIIGARQGRGGLAAALDDVARFRQIMEGHAPLPYARVTRMLLRRMELVDALRLTLLLAATKRRAGPTPRS